MIPVEGFLLDVYGDPDRDEIVAWVRTSDGARPVREPFHPTFYVHARGGVGELRELASALEPLHEAGSLGIVPQRLALEDAPTPVLRVPVTRFRALHRLARLVDGRGEHHRYDLYNVDLRLSLRWLLARGLFPFAQVTYAGPDAGSGGSGTWNLRDDPGSMGYDAPGLVTARLEVEVDAPAGRVPTGSDAVAHAVLGGERLEGSEAEVLEDLAGMMREQDPDVLLTRGGDTFLLPYLAHRAVVRGLDGWTLGRDPGADAHFVGRRAKSFETYGRVRHQPRSVRLHGRVHLDMESSFFWREAGLHGLVDLARVSSVPLAELARVGAGTAMSAIQVHRAAREGRLVPWRKNRPESFKTARTLLDADRGGYQFEPSVGLHGDVVELDFASLYPNLMVHRNLSPETLNCACCDPGRDGFPTGRIVPQLPYHACAKRRGFIPRCLDPVIERREHFKRLRREHPEHRERFQQAVDAYKWLLVVSFGYQGYKNAKFGRIEVHESICAWGREVLLTASDIAREHGFEVLHGLVDSLWLTREHPGADEHVLAEAVGEALGVPLEVEGRYDWILFLPTRSHNPDAGSPRIGALNRYVGCFDEAPDHPTRSQAGQDEDYLAGGALKVRGVELRQSSAPPFVVRVQERVLEVLARARNPQGVRARVPEALDAVRPFLARLDRGEVPLRDLVVTKHVQKRRDAYKVMNDQRAALEQLHARGVEVAPGEQVSYVLLDAGNRDPDERLVEARLMTGSEAYDAAAYRTLALRAVESLLLPFGWTVERLRDRFAPGTQRRLPAYT